MGAVIDLSPAELAAQELNNSGMTPRERDVLVLTAKGLSRQQIGEAMGLSPHTVADHRKKLLNRMDMTMIEAVVLAVKAGWV